MFPVFQIFPTGFFGSEHGRQEEQEARTAELGHLELPHCPQVPEASAHIASDYWSCWSERATEDEVVGWHLRLNGLEFEQTLGDSRGQRSLCAAVHGVAESDRTYQRSRNDRSCPGFPKAREYWSCPWFLKPSAHRSCPWFPKAGDHRNCLRFLMRGMS